MKDCYNHLYINNLANLEEMDKFLETYNLPRLSLGGIENLSRHITSKEIAISQQLKAQD